jgi:hypothetical protein
MKTQKDKLKMMTNKHKIIYYEFNDDGGILKRIFLPDYLITFADTNIVFNVSLPDKKGRHRGIDIPMRIILREISKGITWIANKNKRDENERGL